MISDASSSPQSPNIVIVGTGIAGLAAAVRLADEGLAVTLLAPSQADEQASPGPDALAPEGGDVILGCCGHVLDLHRRLGLDSRIRWDRQLNWLDPEGQLDTLAGDDLPAPLHMLRSLLGLSVFTAGQRIALLRGLLALMQVSPPSRAQLADQPFAQWLRRHRQAQAVIDRFWSPLASVACGARAEHVAAGEAIRVFQEGLLHHEATYELGVTSVTHDMLLAAARDRIEHAGGRLIADGGLTRIELDQGQRVVRLHQADGQEVPVDHAILALAPPRLLEAAGDLGQVDPRFSQLAALEPVPALDVHLRIAARSQEPIMPAPHLIVMESAVPLIIRRAVEDVAGERIEHLQAVLPAAGQWIDRPESQIGADVEAELRRLLPAGRWGQVIDRQVIKRPERAYTAPIVPASHRPTISGPIDNLDLVGSWTHTGWPANLEGAAAAGTDAAHHLLQRLGRATTPPAEIRPAPSFLYRLLSG